MSPLSDLSLMLLFDVAVDEAAANVIVETRRRNNVRF